MSAVSLKAVALRYLAQREHSRAELEQKLRRHLSKVSRGSAAGRRQSHAASGGPVRAAVDDSAASEADVRGAHTDDARAGDAHAGDADAGDGGAGDKDAVGAGADSPYADQAYADQASANEVDSSGRIAAALDALASSGLLSDERTAASVLRVQSQRYGALRIKHTLQSKGLSAELVADTVASARETELQRARAVWSRRFGTPAQSPQDRIRQMRFLAQRGFDANTVARVMRMASGRLRADDDAAMEGGSEDPDAASATKKHRPAADSDPNTPL